MRKKRGRPVMVYLQDDYILALDELADNLGTNRSNLIKEMIDIFHNLYLQGKIKRGGIIVELNDEKSEILK